jgi:hypothetical protein
MSDGRAKVAVMSTPMPSDLHNAVADQLDAVQAIRRRVTELRREYARFDAARLGADELGDTTTAAETLTAARESLSDLDRALGIATDAVYAAMRHTSRLYQLDAE